MANRSVKPTRLRRSAYFRSLAPKKTNLFSPCLFKRHSVSQVLFSAGFVVFLGFACWRCVLQALRCLGGAALFHSSRPSPNSCYPFWLLALTFRSSRPAYGGRLTSPVSLRKTRFIQPHVLFTGIYLLKRLFVGFWVSRRALPLGAAPVFSFFASIVPPRWHNVFSQFAPVVNSAVSVLASGSNFAVKPTRILRSAYLARYTSTIERKIYGRYGRAEA